MLTIIIIKLNFNKILKFKFKINLNYNHFNNYYIIELLYYTKLTKKNFYFIIQQF